MQRVRTGRDASLTIRMSCVLAALGVFYGAVAALTVTVVFDSWPHGHEIRGLLLSLMLVTVGWAHFWIADDLVLKSSRAYVVNRATEPELHTAIDRLALLADIAPPKLALSPLDSPNSFAVGLRRGKRTVVVTHTLRDRLTRSELEAVLAHEISHIANRDALVLTAASFYRSLAAMFGDPQLLNAQTGANRDTREYLPRILLAPIRWSLLAIGAPLTRALSRYREYTADVGATLLTGSPESLMSALIKLEGDPRGTPRHDLRLVAGAHPFLLLPMRSSRWSLMMDHPPLGKRLARLERLARDMHAGA
jgi:heat shock protein HtpX